LFNRLTASRKAIVGNDPGITRDRMYGEVDWKAKTFRLVDTGGIVPDDEAVIPANIFKQASQAINESSAIIWVVDSRAGIIPLDEELAVLLRNTGKPVFIAANKSESRRVEEEAAEFHRFGFELVPVSAEHGNGVGDLIDEVFDVLDFEHEPDEEKTGEIKLATAPSPKTNPYGMVIDSKGTPWFVQFNVNKLASINPNTMEIKEYTLPNPETRPRRVAITSDDVLWYADYSRGYLGRFDTNTGAVREWASPGGPMSQPYGITALNDVIWYSESAVSPNTLVRFDPKTEKFQTWIIPSGGGVVRNMMTTADGNLVMACSGRNRVALVEIEQKKTAAR